VKVDVIEMRHFVLEELEDVRITAMRGDRFVLTGKQHHRRGKKDLCDVAAIVALSAGR
jgi:hypothetical protein